MKKKIMLLALCTMMLFPVMAQVKRYNWVKVTLKNGGNTVIIDNGEKEVLLDEDGNPIRFIDKMDKVIEVMESRGFEFIDYYYVMTGSHWILMRKEIKEEE